MSICRRGLSGMDLAILQAVKDYPCNGMTQLAGTIEAGSGCLSYVGERVRRLQSLGLLEVEFPRWACSGHKIIIKKRRGR